MLETTDIVSQRPPMEGRRSWWSVPTRGWVTAQLPVLRTR